jgi:trk system potassium uptake protein TrkA
MGAEYCLTLVHRADYADVISDNSERLGILGAVSPRVTTNRDLLRFVTSEKYHRVISLNGGAEVIQLSLQNKEISGRKVKEIEWPKGSALVALLRDQDAIVPSGDDDLQLGDTIYAITIPNAIKPLVQLLAH